MVQIGGIELQSKSYRPVSLNSAKKKFEKPIRNTMHGFWKNQNSLQVTKFGFRQD